MDCGSTYIAMCDCPEIQGQKPKTDFGYRLDHCLLNRSLKDGREQQLVFTKDDDNVWHGFNTYVLYNYGWRKLTRILRNQPIDDVYLTPRIWLPRQDQLQEMVKDPIDWSQDFFEFWYAFFGDEDRDDCGACLVTPGWASGIKEGIRHGVMQFDSWEQLWLAFVMHELHSKVWDGEGWTGN